MLDLIMLSNFDKSAGGMETWAYGFIPKLVKSDDRLDLQIYGLTPYPDDEKCRELYKQIPESMHQRLHIKLFKVIWPKFPWFFSMFYQFIFSNKKDLRPSPEIVLAVGGFFELLCMIFNRKYKNSKKILWMRTIFFNEKSHRVPRLLLPIAKRIEIHYLKKVDLLLGNGTDIAELYKKYGLKVHTIRNGVELDKWSNGQNFSGDKTNVAFIGRLAKAKGVCEFLKSVEIVKQGPYSSEINFSVIGDGPYSDQVRSLEQKGWLTYLGAVDNDLLPEKLSKIDVCVALTLSSNDGGGGGTSNALLEQMAAARTILAWDNAIFTQMLNNSNSYLVAQGDTAALAEVIQFIHNNRGEAQQKARIGNAFVSQFSNDAQVDKFKQTLESHL